LELSAFLNQIAGSLVHPRAGTYRNVNGVYMKLMNFRRLDPLYVNAGKRGLTSGNRDEVVVWELYSSDAAHLSRVCEAIRAAANCIDLPEEKDACDYDAPEGRILTRMHRYRERDRDLVTRAKHAALKSHGRLACEACGFDFREAYGPRGDGLIEAHHTRPLHTVTPGHRTKVTDLALLCANCHRIVHAKHQWLTVQELKELLQQKG